MQPIIEWVSIPGGAVALELDGYGVAPTVVPVAPLAIARYPVTNAQFAPFVEAGGYADSQWWTDVGWQARTRERWTEPRYWQSGEWNRADWPVVGVSWYEGAAFCAWLSARIGASVTLPTEAQWQRAAQGDDGRDFPWGAYEPDDVFCNWNRAVDTTTPVQRYPDGASPFGVLDMAGNVWEWCATLWDPDEVIDARAQRVLRGGCWSSDSPFSLRTAHRSASDPNTRQPPVTRDTRYGFRVVRG